jgi:hypothetical protein
MLFGVLPEPTDQGPGSPWVAMRVAALTVDPFTSTPIVILKDEAGAHSVPIWIGMVEASAIATELDQIRLDRPQSHDLMASMLRKLGARPMRVDIVDLVDHTFYATLHVVDAGGREIAIDARPSDAIALALRTGAAIHVAHKVIARARRIDLRVEPDGPNLRRDAVCAEGAEIPDPVASGGSGGAALEQEPGGEVGVGVLERLDAVAFGKWKM